MIAHVAEAREQRGRVVVQLGAAGRPSPLALEAAVRIAQAFGSEIESLFVEDESLLALAGLPFAREVSLSGGTLRPLSPAAIERDIRAAGASLMRHVEALAQRAEVPVHRRIIRDEPRNALAQACAECGPWNVVALTEPLRPGLAWEIRALFERVADATGVVVAGQTLARRPKVSAGNTIGAIVALVEEIERLPHTLRMAERLSAVMGGDVRMVLVGESDEQVLWMEGQARLVLDDAGALAITAFPLPGNGVPGLFDILRRQGCGFLIAPFGGRVISDDGGWEQPAASLGCPLFLER